MGALPSPTVSRPAAASARPFEGVARRLPCADGGEIFLLETQAQGPRRAEVVLVPPFGRSVHDLFIFSYYLRANGFQVVRFDPRNHVGLGSGDIEDFRLSQLERDLEGVVAARRDPCLPLILLGTSLSAPVVIRFAARHREVAGAVTLVGVVDVPETLERATGQSIRPYREPGDHGAPYQTLFGYRVSAQGFVDDMDRHGYGSFTDSLADARAIETPVHLVASTNDEYVDFAKVRELASALRDGSQLMVLEDASHELGRSLGATRQAMALVTKLCLSTLPGGEACYVAPKLTEMIEASSVESRHLAALSDGDTAQVTGAVP
ncbi:MAG: alpha/beta fold hydrolase [Deltaproteobacteria bacterium]|nr:alpha/beta fold hydrolase [Deltaproteobacteria bacterium]